MYTFDIVGYATNEKIAVYVTEQTIIAVCHGLNTGEIVALDHSEILSVNAIREYVNSLHDDFNDMIITLAVCYPENVLATNWNMLENNMIAIPFNWNTKTRFQVENNTITIQQA